MVLDMHKVVWRFQFTISDLFVMEPVSEAAHTMSLCEVRHGFELGNSFRLQLTRIVVVGKKLNVDLFIEVIVDVYDRIDTHPIPRAHLFFFGTMPVLEAAVFTRADAFSVIFVGFQTHQATPCTAICATTIDDVTFQQWREHAIVENSVVVRRIEVRGVLFVPVRP